MVKGFDSRTMLHPGRSLISYNYDKLSRSSINGLKVCLLTLLVPNLIRSRKVIFGKDRKAGLKRLLAVLYDYLKAALFLAMSTGLPFTMITLIPFHSMPFPWANMGFRIAWAYGIVPISSGLMM